MNKAIKKIIALLMTIAMIPTAAVMNSAAAETDQYRAECGADGKVVITGSVSPADEKYFVSLRVLKSGAKLSDLTGNPASDIAITDFIDQIEVSKGDTEAEFDFVLPDGESGKRAARLTYSSGETRDLTLDYIKTADYAAAASAVNAALASFDTFKAACEKGNNLFCLGFEEEDASMRNNALKYMYESVKTTGISASDRLETVRMFEASVLAAACRQGSVNPDDYRSAFKYFGDDVTEWIDFVFAAPKATEKFQSFMSGASYNNLEEFGNALKEGLILAVVCYPNGAGNIGRIFKTFSDLTNIKTDSETAIYQKLSGNYNSLEAILQKYSELKKSDNNSNKYDNLVNNSSGGGGSTVSMQIPSNSSEKDTSVKPLKIQFTDLDIADWAYEAITSLAERGIVSGRTSTTFAPLDNVTREEFVKLLVCAAGYENREYTGGRFIDVAGGSWYEKYVCIAAESGLVNGIEENKFGVGENVTRQDMLVMIYRALNKKNTAPAAAEPAFADASEIADYAKDAVGGLSAGGYVSGVGDNKFNPEGTATRAETAQMLYNVISLLSDGDAKDASESGGGAQISAKRSASASRDRNYENAFSLLSNLEIYDNGMSYDKTEANDSVTRGDFAVYFARLMKLGGMGVSALYYTDVPKSHYAFDEIGVLTEYGYISETEDKKFRPDAPISSREAAMTAIKGLGVNDIIKSGLFDESFIHNAMSEAGISYGGDEDLTFRDMTMMLYNVLLADCYKLTGGTGAYGNYSKTDGDSLLYNTRKMRYVKKGFLTAANGMDIYGVETNAKSVVIDGMVFDAGNKNYVRFLGRNVDYVYSDEDGLTLCWAAERDGTEEIMLTIGNDGGYDSQKNEFWYYEDNRERRIRIAGSAVMLYNGRPLTGGAEEILSRPNTQVKLLSSDGSSAYDIVLIDGYYNMVVTGKNSDTCTVFDKNSSGSIKLDKDLYECFSIEDKAGIECDWSVIQDGAVLSVFQSQDGQCLRVVVSEDTITGNVSKTDNKGHVVINDEIYEVYSEDLLAKLSVGTLVTCSLDCFGYIAEVQTQASSDRFVGFALSGFYDGDHGDEILGMKILSETGNIEYYEVNKKININGRTYKNVQEAFSQLTENGEFKPQIMLCKLNSDGNLTRIDTASPDDGGVHPLTINREVKKDLERVEYGMYAGGRIGVNMLTNSNTKVFSVPENLGTDFSRCFVSSLRMWDDYRGAVSYRTTSEDTFYEQYIVTRQITYGDTASNHALQMIDEIYTSVDNNDEIVQNIVYTTGAGTSEAVVAKYLDLDAYNLKRGDAVRLATTASNQNQVEYVSIVSRAGENTAVGESLRETPYATRTISAYAYDKLGFAVKLGWDSGDTFDEIIEINSGTPIAVYDSEKDEVRIGTVEDIKTYRSDGEASRLLIQSYQGNLQRVFVYR